MKLVVVLMSVFGAFAATGCTNPLQPTGHPGAPPVVPTITYQGAYPNEPHVPGNVAPAKYGVPALMEYARVQSAASRPGAEISIKEDQYRMASAIGRTKTK